MEFNQLMGFVFDSESGVIGAVASVDFIKQTISILMDDDEIIIAKLENAKFLEQIGAIGEVEVINHDVVSTADGKLYEIVSVDDKNAQLHLLNKKLERVESGDIILKTDLHVLAPYVTVIGNIHELEPEAVVDFNIKVVRLNIGGEIKFFYACNNLENEEVDLIKVVFVGHHLLKEESYERITLSHEEYLGKVDNGKILETDPQALMNYMTGLMHGKKPMTQPEIKDEVEDSKVDTDDFEGDFEDDYCEDCGESLEDCDCDCEW